MLVVPEQRIDYQIITFHNICPTMVKKSDTDPSENFKLPERQLLQFVRGRCENHIHVCAPVVEIPRSSHPPTAVVTLPSHDKYLLPLNPSHNRSRLGRNGPSCVLHHHREVYAKVLDQPSIELCHLFR